MLDFIVNPIAGGKKGKKIRKALEQIEARLNQTHTQYAIHRTERPHHATAITEELIKSGATDVIVIGGDGTLHEVINGFSDFNNTTLGIIPCGTGNDFADALKLPHDPLEALDIVLNGKSKYCDFMQMPTIRGLNIIGMGMDVEVLKRYSACKKKTKFTYTSCLIKTLFGFKMINFSAKLNGEERTYRSFIACVANGRTYGGGIPICPPAVPDDKRLDFVAVKEIKGLKLIAAFLKLKKGKLLTLPQAYHTNMQEISISPEGDYWVNVDGELYANIPFDVKIVSDSLKVYVR